MRMARISYWVPVLGLVPLLTSCSDPVPPASQGAASIAFANPDDPTGTSTARCPVPHTSTAPILTAGNVRTTDVSKGSIAIDGENGNLVQCTVSPGGGGYNVYAKIHSDVTTAQGRQWSDIVISNLTIGAGGVDVPGMLTVMDNITDQIAYLSPSTDPCKFTVTGGSLGIGGGKIWGKVACPTLKDPANAGGDKCKATGYFIFENCAQ
jgi:hypothetical protein